MDTTNTVSTRQFVALTLIIGLGLNMLNLPALTVMTGGRDGWVSMLIIAAVDCLMLYLTLLFMQKFEVRSPKACKALRICVGIVGFLWATAKIMLILGEARLFYGETVFENLNWTIFLALLGALVAILGAGSGRALGRLCELALPTVLASVAILLLMSYVGDVDMSDVLPILYKNPEALKSPLKFAMWTGNYPVLFAFMGHVKIEKFTKLKCVIAAALSGLASAALTFPLAASYGAVKGLISYGNNSSDMNQYVGSYNFGRVDLIIFTVWSIALLIECGIFMYAAVRSLSAVVGKQKPWLYSSITALAVYLLLNCVLTCNFKLYDFSVRFAVYGANIIQVLLPIAAVIALGICMAVKRLKNRTKGENRQ